jgi:acetaldehyde dehydrogenase (acetylating)
VITCWITPNSAGLASNRDGVKVAATLGTNTQTLSVNDLVTTSRPSDQIDLVCTVTSGEGADSGQQGRVTQASMIALDVAQATTNATDPAQN